MTTATSTESFQARLCALVHAIGTGRSAKICGVDRRTIQHWIAGRITPNPVSQSGALFLLALALKEAGNPPRVGVGLARAKTLPSDPVESK